MPTKSHPPAKSRRARRPPNHRGTTSKIGRLRCKRGKSSGERETREPRDLRATLVNAFLQWRDQPSCPKEARASLDAMAESVDYIPRDILRVYLALIDTSANLTEFHGTLSTAEKELMMSVRDGTYKPADAHCYLLNVLRFTLNDSGLWGAAVASDVGGGRAFCSTLLKMCDEIERADRVAVTGETLH